MITAQQARARIEAIHREMIKQPERISELRPEREDLLAALGEAEARAELEAAQAALREPPAPKQRPPRWQLDREWDEHYRFLSRSSLSKRQREWIRDRFGCARYARMPK